MENFLGLLFGVSTWGSLVGTVVGGAAYLFLPEHLPRIEIGIVLFVFSMVVGRVIEFMVISRKSQAAFPNQTLKRTGRKRRNFLHSYGRPAA